MKNILLATIALTVLHTANAQKGLGIQAGVIFSNLTSKFEGKKEKHDMKTGFQVGVNYDIAIADEFYVQPGLNFVQAGAKEKDFDGKISYNYLQLPITFQYKPTLGTGKLILGAGPFFSMGVGDIKSLDEGESSKETWDEAGAKKTDAGAKIIVGYQLSNGLNFNLNTDLGLINISKDGDSDNYNKNVAFGFTVGFRF